MSLGETWQLDLEDLSRVGTRDLPAASECCKHGERGLAVSVSSSATAFDDSCAQKTFYPSGPTGFPSGPYGGLYTELEKTFDEVRSKLQDQLNSLAGNLDESARAVLEIHRRYLHVEGMDQVREKR